MLNRDLRAFAVVCVYENLSKLWFCRASGGWRYWISHLWLYGGQRLLHIRNQVVDVLDAH